MRMSLGPFVAVIALLPACVVSTTNPPADPVRSVPPGQLRSEQVHERNEERKTQKDDKKGMKPPPGQVRSDQVQERNEGKKAEKDKLKAEK
jgi:hypothetical protein